MLNEICKLILVKILSSHSLKALDSVYSRLHQRLQNASDALIATFNEVNMPRKTIFWSFENIISYFVVGNNVQSTGNNMASCWIQYLEPSHSQVSWVVGNHHENTPIQC